MQGCTNIARGMTEWIQEVEQCQEQLPRSRERDVQGCTNIAGGRSRERDVQRCTSNPGGCCQIVKRYNLKVPKKIYFKTSHEILRAIRQALYFARQRSLYMPASQTDSSY